MTDDRHNPPAALTRRALLSRTTWALGALSAAPLLARGTPAVAADSPVDAALPVREDRPLQIGMLLFPGVTLLDLVGPQLAFALAGVSHVVAKTRDPVMSDTGLALTPTSTYDECPKDLDVLFVPGGGGTADAMENEQILRFLSDRAETSTYVTSVCTGALILAAAGLLRGYRATTHWQTLEALAAFDVEVVRQRVVIDRNRMTGGGVTAGIDFGLSLVAHLRGEQMAKTTQLMMEYTPEPPFDAGSPEGAGPEIAGSLRNRRKPMNERLLRTAQAAARRLGESPP